MKLPDMKDNASSRCGSLLNKNSVSHKSNFPSVCQKVPWAPKAIQVVAITLSSLLEFNSKILLLKTHLFKS